MAKRPTLIERTIAQLQAEIDSRLHAIEALKQQQAQQKPKPAKTDGAA